jgi:hypothetical protein
MTPVKVAFRFATSVGGSHPNYGIQPTRFARG